MDLMLRCCTCANMISASVLSLSFDIISQYQPTLLSVRGTCHAGACPVMMVPFGMFRRFVSETSIRLQGVGE